MALWNTLFGRRDRSPEARFWAWFTDHSERLLQAGPDVQAPVYRRLGEQLRHYDDGLTWEMAAKRDPREFVVSADGSRALFPAVRRLIDAAPEVPGWTFIAFRQRSADKFELEFGGIKISPDDVWFRSEPAGSVCHLAVYLPGLTADNEPMLGNAAFIMMDALLGEYDTTTKVGRIEFAALPVDPVAAGLQPFSRLAEVIDDPEGTRIN